MQKSSFIMTKEVYRHFKYPNTLTNFPSLRRHHQTEMEGISLSHTAQTLSEEVKARLKAAKEVGARKKEELLSFARQNGVPKKKVEDKAEGSHLAGGSGGVQTEEEYSKEKQPLQRSSPSQQQLLKHQKQQVQQQQLLQQQQVQKKQQQLLQNQQQQFLLQKQQKLRQQNELLKQLQYKQNVLKSSAALASSSEKANARNARTAQQHETPKSKNPVQTTEAQFNYQASENKPLRI